MGTLLSGFYLKNPYVPLLPEVFFGSEEGSRVGFAFALPNVFEIMSPPELRMRAIFDIVMSPEQGGRKKDLRRKIVFLGQDLHY